MADAWVKSNGNPDIAVANVAHAVAKTLALDGQSNDWEIVTDAIKKAALKQYTDFLDNAEPASYEKHPSLFNWATKDIYSTFNPASGHFRVSIENGAEESCCETNAGGVPKKYHVLISGTVWKPTAMDECQVVVTDYLCRRE